MNLHAFLAEVEPLPDQKVLEPARKALEKLRHTVSWTTDVAIFSTRVTSMPVGLRKHSLSLLCKNLDSQKLEIVAQLAANEQSRQACLPDDHHS